MRHRVLFTRLIFVIPLLIFFPDMCSAATTTIQIYPTDDVAQELYDNENQTVWSSARGYTGTFAQPLNSTATNITLRSDKGTGKYRIYRASLLFDTSVIPDNATIQTASFKVSKLNYANNTPIVLTQHSRTSTTSPASSDWHQSQYGSEISRGTLGAGYTTYDLNSAGLSYLNPSGYTDIGVRTESDYDNTDPGSTVTGAAFSSSEAGTSTRPYLEVTYTIEPSTIQIYPTDDVAQELYDNENQTVWSSARGYTGTFARPLNSTSTNITIRSDKGTGKYRIYRASLLFDTSVIPDNATIQSASFKANKVTYANNTPIVLTEHSRASTTSPASSDWHQSQYGSEISRGTLGTGYTTYNLNSTGLSYLNPSGYTDIGVRTESDYDNVDPGFTITGAAFDSSEAGTSTRPYLEVTYLYAQD